VLCDADFVNGVMIQKYLLLRITVCVELASNGVVNLPIGLIFAIPHPLPKVCKVFEIKGIAWYF